MKKQVEIDLTMEELMSLERLKKQLLTQDNAATAKPILIQVAYDDYVEVPYDCYYDERVIYESYPANRTYYFDDREELIESLFKYEGDDTLEVYGQTFTKESLLARVEQDQNLSIIATMIEDEETPGIEDQFQVRYLDKITRYDGFFLTTKACKEYIKQNQSKYNNPRPYIRSVAQNQEFILLTKLLLSTEWDVNSPSLKKRLA